MHAKVRVDEVLPFIPNIKKEPCLVGLSNFTAIHHLLVRLQIQHSTPVPPPIRRQHQVSTLDVGSHVPRLRLPLQQPYDPILQLQAHHQILEPPNSRALYHTYQCSILVRNHEFRLRLFHCLTTAPNGLAP